MTASTLAVLEPHSITNLFRPMPANFAKRNTSSQSYSAIFRVQTGPPVIDTIPSSREQEKAEKLVPQVILETDALKSDWGAVSSQNAVSQKNLNSILIYWNSELQD